MAPLRLAVFAGSARANNNCTGIAKWATEILKSVAPEASVASIDQNSAPHPLGPLSSPIAPLALPYIGGKRQSDGTVVWPYVDPKEAEWSKIVQNLDGMVIVTPEYNKCIPGDVKNAIDHIFPEWENFPIAVVNYGGQAGDSCAEQMNVVLKAIKANNISQGQIQVQIPFGEYIAGMKRTDGTDECLKVHSEKAKEVFGKLVKAAEKRQEFHAENKKKYEGGETDVRVQM